MRHTADSITDDQLDALYERLDKHVRAVERASGLAEQWDGDPAPITRSEASRLLDEVLRLSGWEQGDPRPTLSVVPEAESVS